MRYTIECVFLGLKSLGFVRLCLQHIGISEMTFGKCYKHPDSPSFRSVLIFDIHLLAFLNLLEGFPDRFYRRLCPPKRASKRR